MYYNIIKYQNGTLVVDNCTYFHMCNFAFYFMADFQLPVICVTIIVVLKCIGNNRFGQIKEKLLPRDSQLFSRELTCV